MRSGCKKYTVKPLQCTARRFRVNGRMDKRCHVNRAPIRFEMERYGINRLSFISDGMDDGDLT